MAISRYDERGMLNNAFGRYVRSDIFAKRQLNSVVQYSTAELDYPSPSDISENLTLETRIWTVGTKYFKLANEFYNDPQYWWIIAWFNMRPLETDFEPGDLVTIPTPLQSILSELGML